MTLVQNEDSIFQKDFSRLAIFLIFLDFASPEDKQDVIFVFEASAMSTFVDTRDMTDVIIVVIFECLITWC